MTAERVSLVVVNMDGRDHLETFLPSLLAQDYPNLELVLVDNGSRDDSLAVVRALYPTATILENAGNEGFARANNQGMQAATGRLVCLVNNDMKLEPDFVSQLVAFHARKNGQFACVGARILNWDGTLVDFIEAGMTFEGKGLQLDYGIPVDSPKGQGAEHALLFACGGALLIERAVYLEVGGLDEDFFAYYEDVDLGWRLWVRGYQVAFCPTAVAYHRHNGTSQRFQAHRKEVLLERNGLYAMIKNYDDATLAKCLPAALLMASKRLAVRSGLSRADWAFAALSTPAPLPVVQAKLLDKVIGKLRSHGLRATTRKALAKVGQRLVERYGATPGPTAAGVLMPPEAYATAVALEDLLDHLPALLRKRQEIQAARRRPDGEILRLFNLPYHAVEGRANYPAVQDALLAAFGIPAYFEARINEAAEAVS